LTNGLDRTGVNTCPVGHSMLIQLIKYMMFIFCYRRYLLAVLLFTLFYSGPLVATKSVYLPDPTFKAQLVNGSSSDIQATPWLVSIGRHYSHSGRLCGGSLIAPRWVLTAAHCFTNVTRNNPSALDVIIGRSNLQDSQQGERITVQALYLHPDFDPSSLTADIALVELSQASQAPPLALALEVDPLAPGQLTHITGWGILAESPSHFLSFFYQLTRNEGLSRTIQQLTLRGIDEKTMVATALLADQQAALHNERKIRLNDSIGFTELVALLRKQGGTVPEPLNFHTLYTALQAQGVSPEAMLQHLEFIFPTQLQQLRYPLVSRQRCQQTWGDDITDHLLCAGYSHGGQGFCSGDSGLPLTVQTAAGQWLQIGLTSFNHVCAASELYDVYTRTSRYLNFIGQHVPELQVYPLRAPAQRSGVLLNQGGQCLQAHIPLRHGAPVTMQPCNNSLGQQWYWVDGLVVNGQGLCLGVAKTAATLRGAVLYSYFCDRDNYGQQWHWQGQQLRNGGGLCADIHFPAWQRAGAPAQLWPCLTIPNQHWTLDVHPPRRLVNAAGNCLVLPSDHSRQVQTWPCRPDHAPQWRPFGKHLIHRNGLCLTVPLPSDNGQAVQVAPCQAEAAQQWTWQDGQLHHAEQRCLDVRLSELTQNGGFVQVWACNGEIQQQWQWQ
jgi:secreted trypsin-like serine protease